MNNLMYKAKRRNQDVSQDLKCFRWLSSVPDMQLPGDCSTYQVTAHASFEDLKLDIGSWSLSYLVLSEVVSGSVGWSLS